jgi:prephenate dehydratase
MSPNVAYPGPAGSHTSAAAATLFPTDTLLPLQGFRAVADAVVSHDATFGVLPIESSLAGAVAETHDLLYERALSIVGRRSCRSGTVLRVCRRSLEDAFRTPSALEQCRDLLARPERVRDRVVDDDAGAKPPRTIDRCRDRRRRSGRALRADGARARRRRTLAFALRVDRAIHPRRCDLRDVRTAFTFATNHKPGALFAAIEPFARAGLDLVRLVSRPLPATPWKYRFDAVVAGHPLEPAVQVALRELDAVTRTLRVVGVYEGHAEGSMRLYRKGAQSPRPGTRTSSACGEISDLDRSLVGS